MNKRIRRRLLLAAAACLGLTGAHGVASAAVQVEAVSGPLFPGKKVAISGTTDETEVTVQIFRPDLGTLYVTVVPVVNGTFAAAFSLPSDAQLGTYEVIAGRGAAFDEETFAVGTVDDAIESIEEPTIEDVLKTLRDVWETFEREDVEQFLNAIEPKLLE